MKTTRTRVRTLVAATAVAATCSVGGASFATATTLPASAPTTVTAPSGDSIGSLSLDEMKKRISEAIDERVAMLQRVAKRVAESERLSAEQKARIAQALADKQAALTTLKSNVNAQTTKKGVVKVLRDARRDGTVPGWGEHRWGDRTGHRDGDRDSYRDSYRDREHDGDRDGARDGSGDGDRDWSDHDGHQDGDHAGDEDGDRDSEHAGEHDGERDGRR